MAEKYMLGSFHETNSSGWLEVVGYVDRDQRKVRFTDTGFETITRLSSIRLGMVKDPYSPSVLGVGYLGEPISHPLYRVLYTRWVTMLKRVYVFKMGKSVSSEWLCFANFLKDAIELEGFELFQNSSIRKQIDLDGDIIPLSKGKPPMYSRDTCKWVRHIDNLRARKPRQRSVKRPIGTVIESRHGPVTIIGKNKQKWLIRFSDGTECWKWRNDVLRNSFGKPKSTEVV